MLAHARDVVHETRSAPTVLTGRCGHLQQRYQASRAEYRREALVHQPLPVNLVRRTIGQACTAAPFGIALTGAHPSPDRGA